MGKKRARLIACWTLLAALGLGTIHALFLGCAPEASAFFSVRHPDETLVIDAGHGGEDGGAVSRSGVPESGVNLAIARKLDHLLGLYGMAPTLLRQEDISLHDENATTLREKKVSDLRNRVAAIESAENATLISIHQNTYPSAKYHGAQVFYSDAALSLPFAQRTQTLLRQALDPENSRVPAKIPDTVYLMNHISCRAILVECGFLSNFEEEQKLLTGEYQSKIAVALAAAWLQTTTDEEASPQYEGKNTVLLHRMRQ